MHSIPRATGCTITRQDLLKENSKYLITEFGAKVGGNPVTNTVAINNAITTAHENGGGTVVFPAGDFKTYTIRLKSNVNLYLMKDSVIHAARTEIKHSYEVQVGEGGNYDEPEVNLYAGLQDHGHTYFCNSLIYGENLTNIMIYGEGLIDGSYIDEESGYRKYVLMGGDPIDNPKRDERGHVGEWFGNKAIALVCCSNIILSDFSILIGGHFAIIAEGVDNMLAEHLLVDTTRDAFDIDCCENVTVRHSTFNSLTDDALVMKASYGAGIFKPLKNVLIEDCVVSGYDAGSVYAGKYTQDKLIATDRCGPTARVKLGTESTCGYDLVTIKKVHFDRSRGFALEAVDISDLSNIVFTDCTMDNVSSSPIFIKIGDRGRFPVTGNSADTLINTKDGNVRLDNRGWVLPNTKDYQTYPAMRYIPSYDKSTVVSVDGHSEFSIVNQETPAKINTANFAEEQGHYYALKFDTETKNYIPDYTKEILKKDLVKYANAVGSPNLPKVYNIEISNIKVTNADPRYPIIIMGLMDSKIENISMKNIDIEYRGGLTMEHAVEQRQLNTNWEYSQYETKQSVQTLPWLVNTFFLKEEGLLPRVSWDKINNTWVDDPYNVPELPNVYPEPSNWGILPAYGMYVRHAENIELSNVTFSCKVMDERHPIVLDDVTTFSLENFNTTCKEGMAHVALVTNQYKRPTNLEYVKNEPYITTTVTNTNISKECEILEVTVAAPAPGTPRDQLYDSPTLPIPAFGYHYTIPTEDYPLPLTVHRPFFAPLESQVVSVNEEVNFSVILRNPAFEVSTTESDSFIYNEAITKKDFVVSGIKNLVKLTVENSPAGAQFNSENGSFRWTPKQKGTFILTFIADDGIIPEKLSVTIEVQ